VSTATVERLRQLVQDALLPVALDVQDDSAAHRGHAGARDGKGHYRMRIVSARFTGLRALERHRLVNQLVGELFRSEVHALAIEALAPEEVK
jgi:BolA family transcriptional regulator, general stress-responsive regulator